jgi:sterol desaturase/sphingolipid hydroxylase (fatty acid hydroxylase superfamily)
VLKWTYFSSLSSLPFLRNLFHILKRAFVVKQGMTYYTLQVNTNWRQAITFTCTLQLNSKLKFKLKVYRKLIWLTACSNPHSGTFLHVLLKWQLLVCWDCGFESHRWQIYLSLVIAVFCQVQISVSGWSLVQRSPTECGISEYDHEAMTTRRPSPIRGFLAMRNEIIKCE